MPLREYVRKKEATVTAVRLDLETDGFTYRKWGGLQRCKAGDWLVDNEGDTYTVDAETFMRTYERVRPGLYRKQGRVWAEQARTAGSIRTQEGETDYAAGDYLVYNDRAGDDGYAMTAEKFHSLYEPADGGLAST